MNLTEYVDSLHHQLAVAARAGGDDARALAERLTAPLESAARLVLLEALSAAADEITGELAPGTVELRLRGGEPEFVVTPPPGDDAFSDLGTGPDTIVAPLADLADSEQGTSRLNLRLPDSLKVRVEQAARTEGLSLNAWLVRAAAAALGPAPHHVRRTPGGERFTGWVR
jgi:HicB family